MPNYDYRCAVCGLVTSRSSSIDKTPKTINCEQCGEQAYKIISKVSVKLSNLSKVEKLDPKYNKMVDAAMRNTTSADPNKYLRKMRPFGSSTD